MYNKLERKFRLFLSPVVTHVPSPDELFILRQRFIPGSTSNVCYCRTWVLMCHLSENGLKEQKGWTWKEFLVFISTLNGEKGKSSENYYLIFMKMKALG